MRNKIWLLLTIQLTQGEILPWWALLLRCILYPLDCFYWQISKGRGYQWESDTWLINGVKFSGATMRFLAGQQDLIGKVTRVGDLVTFEEFKP